MSVKCLVCGEQFESNSVVCVKCNTPHHEECFNSTGCSIYGCGSTEYYLPKLVDGNLVGVETKKANITSLVQRKENLQGKNEVMLETIITPIGGSYANGAITQRTVQINRYILHQDSPLSLLEDFIDTFESAKLVGLDFDRAINYSFETMHIINDAIRQPLLSIANELDKQWDYYLKDGRDSYTLFGFGIGIAGGIAVSRYIEYYCGINIEPFLVSICSIISATVGYNLYPLVDNRDGVIKKLDNDEKELKGKWQPRLEELLETQDPRQSYVETGSNLLLLESKPNNGLSKGKNN